MRLFANANYDFIGRRKRAYAITGALHRDRARRAADPRRQLQRRVHRRHPGPGRDQRRRPTSARAPQRARRRAASRGPRSRPSAPTASSWSAPGWPARAPTPTTPRRRPRPCSRRSTRRSAPGNYTIHRTEAVGPKVGGELRQQAVLAILLSFLAVLAYLAYPVRVALRRRRRDRDRARHPGRARLHRVRPARGQPLRGGGAAHDRRLLAQRHDRDLRPDPREPAPRSSGRASSRSSTARSTRRCRGPFFTGTTALGSLRRAGVLRRRRGAARSRC